MAEINKRQGREVERTGGKEEVKKCRQKNRFTYKIFMGAFEIYSIFFYLLLNVR